MNDKQISQVKHALETALHELTTLQGLHVTDVSSLEYTWDIDNSKSLKLLKEALANLA